MSAASPDPAPLDEQITTLTGEKTRVEGVLKSLKDQRSKITPINTKTTKAYDALTTSITAKEAELAGYTKRLAKITKQKDAPTKTVAVEPVPTVAVKTETPITLDTIDKKIREAASKKAVIDAEIADIGTKKGKPGTSIAKLVEQEEGLKENKVDVTALETKLQAIKAYADALKPFRKRTDDISKYKTLRTTFKQAEAAQKVKATVGTNRALQQAKQQYDEFVTPPLQKLATKIKKLRVAMEAADATFQETPEEKELYGIIKEITEYTLPTATGAAVAATPGSGPAAATATAAATAVAPSAGAPSTPVTPSTTVPSDTTDPSDITFTFLDQTFTVENDFTGEELKPKQKQFLVDMNILPLVEPVLQAPALLTILDNIVNQPICKVDRGLSMIDSCNPMRTLLSTLQEAMWKALDTDSEVLSKLKHSTGPVSKSSIRSGTSGFTTITITLPMSDLYAAMI
jgi:hypothetical protein